MTEFLLGILILIGIAIIFPNYIKWIEKTFYDNDIDGITKHNQKVEESRKPILKRYLELKMMLKHTYDFRTGKRQKMVDEMKEIEKIMKIWSHIDETDEY